MPEYRVLIVDDEEDIRDVLADRLEMMGYETEEAVNGLEGLEALRESEFDAVFLDIQMPELDGFGVLEGIREEGLDATVVMMTAHGSIKNAVQAMSLGAYDFVEKPFEADRVRTSVEKAVAQTELKRERARLQAAVAAHTLELERVNAELLETNRALKEAQNRLILQEKLASLGNLVAGIAHEINNPVGAVNSAVDVAMRCVGRIVSGLAEMDGGGLLRSDDRLRKALDLLQESVQTVATAGDRIALTVKNLKRFAHLDEAEFQKVDLHEGLDSTLAMCEREFGGRIAVEKAYGELPAVYCYAGELNQVFLNLLLNAGQAIAGAGTVRIETRAEGDSVYVRVSDTGKGIAPEDLDKVFDPGFTTRGVGVGVGLGLSISYDIVQKHDGEIRVESEVGKGSTFTVRIPATGRNSG